MENFEISKALNDFKKRIEELASAINIKEVKEELKTNEQLMDSPDFWNNQDKSKVVLKKIKIAKRRMKMNLPLDPMMLLSVVNMNLRDRYASLSDFCTAEDIDQADLEKRLEAIDYFYEADCNQFR